MVCMDNICAVWCSLGNCHLHKIHTCPVIRRLTHRLIDRYTNPSHLLSVVCGTIVYSINVKVWGNESHWSGPVILIDWEKLRSLRDLIASDKHVQVWLCMHKMSSWSEIQDYIITQMNWKAGILKWQTKCLTNLKNMHGSGITIYEYEYMYIYHTH